MDTLLLKNTSLQITAFIFCILCAFLNPAPDRKPIPPEDFASENLQNALKPGLSLILRQSNF